MWRWGDENVDWNGIEAAACFIADYCRRWGRFGGQAKEKYGCYDENTEVLTEAGWKFFRDLEPMDKLAILVDGEHLKYEPPTDIISYDYEGDMYSLRTRGVNLLVTPNHNLYVSRGDSAGTFPGGATQKSYPMEFTTYEKYYRKIKKFKKGATWAGESPAIYTVPEYVSFWNNSKNSKREYFLPSIEFPMEKWLSFLGWYVAEGCSSLKRGEIAICLNGTDGGLEAKEVSSILQTLGISYKEHRRGSGTVLKIYSRQLAVWLDDNCGHLAQNKKSPAFIKQLSPRLIKIYLDALYKGDGHKSVTSNILTTVSKKLSDDVSELLLKAGYSFKISSRNRGLQAAYVLGRRIRSNFPVYEVNWLKKTTTHSTTTHDTKESILEKEKMVYYKGKVYCATVPGNLLYVRREGIPVWCGNSVRFYASFGCYSLISLTHPGYHYTWSIWQPYVKFDNAVGDYIVRYTGLQAFFGWWQPKVYRRAYKLALQRWPHLRQEILCCADYSELLEGL